MQFSELAAVCLYRLYILAVRHSPSYKYYELLVSSKTHGSELCSQGSSKKSILQMIILCVGHYF